MTIVTMIIIVFEDSRMIPFSSFCWNRGRVENMRHKVDTTTNIQDTTATTCKLKVSAKNQGFFNKYILFREYTGWASDVCKMKIWQWRTFIWTQADIWNASIILNTTNIRTDSFSHSIVGKGTCWPLQRWNSADFQRGSKVFFGWLRTCRLQTLLQRCLPRQQRYWISWY